MIVPTYSGALYMIIETAGQLEYGRTDIQNNR